MDKLESSEQMAKAIVEYLIEHDVSQMVTKDYLEKYIREAVLDYLKKEELELIREYFDKERE